MAEIAATSDRAVFVAIGCKSTETALNIKKQLTILHETHTQIKAISAC
jgi:uncharacterized protein YcfL